MSSFKSVLIIEKDTIIALDLSRQVKNLGFNLFGVFEDEKDAFLSLSATPFFPDLIIMNLACANLAFAYFMAWSFIFMYRTPIIITTALRPEEISLFFNHPKIPVILFKPYNYTQLKKALKHIT